MTLYKRKLWQKEIQNQDQLCICLIATVKCTVFYIMSVHNDVAKCLFSTEVTPFSRLQENVHVSP